MIKYDYIPGITIEVADFIKEYTETYSIKFIDNIYKIIIRLEQFSNDKAFILLNNLYNFIKYNDGSIEIIKQTDQVIGNINSYNDEKYGFRCEIIISRG